MPSEASLPDRAGLDLTAPGSVVTELGGRQVHLLVQPGEGPPVVLLGGCGVPSYVWDDVVARMPERWVVRLDRPGLVETAWPGVLPTLAAEVATLADLLGRLGRPAVLVGHSMAGPHAEAAARTVPGAVAGLVLVDGSVEAEPSEPGSGRAWLTAARLTRKAMTVPGLDVLGSLGDRVLVSSQSRRRHLLDVRSALATDTYRRPDTVASVVAEQAAYGAQLWDLAALRRAHPWPGTPTVVLTAAGDGGDAWVGEQQALTRLLDARQVVIEDSRHLVMIDRPDLVVDAVAALAGPHPSDTPTSPEESLP